MLLGSAVHPLSTGDATGLLSFDSQPSAESLAPVQPRGEEQEAQAEPAPSAGSSSKLQRVSAKRGGSLVQRHLDWNRRNLPKITVTILSTKNHRDNLDQNPDSTKDDFKRQ